MHPAVTHCAECDIERGRAHYLFYFFLKSVKGDLQIESKKVKAVNETRIVSVSENDVVAFHFWKRSCKKYQKVKIC